MNYGGNIGIGTGVAASGGGVIGGLAIGSQVMLAVSAVVLAIAIYAVLRRVNRWSADKLQ